MLLDAEAEFAVDEVETETQHVVVTGVSADGEEWEFAQKFFGGCLVLSGMSFAAHRLIAWTRSRFVGACQMGELFFALLKARVLPMRRVNIKFIDFPWYKMGRPSPRICRLMDSIGGSVKCSSVRLKTLGAPPPVLRFKSVSVTLEGFDASARR